MKKLLTYVFVFTFSASGQYLFGQKTLPDTIPFTLTPYSNISIRAVLNQTDTLDLMFHTAVNSVSLTKKAVEKISNIDMSGSHQVTSWGGSSEARHSSNNSVQIGNLSWGELTIWEDEHSGRLTDGKFGPNLFENKIIEIDYDKSLLIIHSSLPEMDEDYEKMAVVFKRSNMMIKADLEIGKVKYQNEFLIHSGFGGTALLDDEFVSINSIGEQLETISESELKDSFGNILKTKKVILPALNIGGSTLSDMPIGFFEGSIGRQKKSVLGGDILKRFNILIDLQQANIYFKPNGLFNAPFIG